MKCPTCGSENLPNKKFCGLCGQSLMAQPAAVGFSGAAPAPHPPPYVDPAQVQPPPQYAAPPSGATAGERPIVGLQKKYKALRVIATCFKILAYVLAALNLLGAVFVLIAPSIFGGRLIQPALSFVFFLLNLLSTGLIFLLFYGLGQYINLQIDLEENTRITNMLLTNRR